MTNVVSMNQMKTITDVINQDGVVAFPTETVFGLGVRYGSLNAFHSLMKAKNRDQSKAITLMISDKKDIHKYAYVSEDAKKLIDAFMPGMITLVFKKKDCVDDEFVNGKKTIGIRIPDHPFVLDLLKEVGPMFVTSANISHQSNTTSTKEVLEQLDGRIDLIVDGECDSSVASSVIDVSEKDIKVLREGRIGLKDIEEVLK